MTEIPVHHFRGRDGVQLAYRELGEGRPLILIHGYLGNAMTMAEAGIAGGSPGRATASSCRTCAATATALSRTTPPPTRQTCWPTTDSH